MEGTEMSDGLFAGFGLIKDQLDVIVSDFDMIGDLVPSLISFAAIFLAVWGTWVGIRAILRAGRLVK